MIGEVIESKGGELVGFWSKEGYDYENSKGERDGMFMGLAIDEDNQPEMTQERLNAWLPQILQEFGLEVETE